MKRKILLLLVMTSFIAVSHAQNKEKKPVTGYALTAVEKGGRSWKEVRLVDIGTGEQVRQVYNSKTEVEPLNARTGKPVVKKEPVKGEIATVHNSRVRTITNVNTNTNTNINTNTNVNVVVEVPKKKVVNLDNELDIASGRKVKVYTVTDASPGVERIKKDGNVIIIRSATFHGPAVQTYNPFATNSAACAYDKKHERLYYTPMGINQLRYIDLKSGKIYYFEDEPFGVVKGSYDSQKQITRMVIASDGNGYALTNDANHLIRFTTGKNPEITDLGALSDDAAKNGSRSVHGGGGGGDMIADASKNLYLITANRQVYKISIDSKVATYMGPITGLPKGFSTNGAMVEEDSKVIIASSESTVGYYRFDLNTLVAEKVSSSPDVFNASDLANGNLAFDKKKKKKKDREQEEEPVVVAPEQPKEEPTTETARTANPQETLKTGSISVYPNPVRNGYFRLAFNDQPAGRYQVQVVDMQGKLVKAQEVNIANKIQIQEFNIPELTAGGSYLVKVTSTENNVSITNKIVVQ
jgi:hypothetical protein